MFQSMENRKLRSIYAAGILEREKSKNGCRSKKNVPRLQKNTEVIIA